MYYYISQPLTSRSEKNKIDDIKSLLSQLGIAGEFATASPARTVEEHLDLAFKKGFTTIVGIGSDVLANQIATMMIQKKYERAAMGFIPVFPNQAMWHMVGTTSLKETGELLRARLLTEIDVLDFNRNKAVILPASITTSEPTSFAFSYNSVTLSGMFSTISLRLSGTILVDVEVTHNQQSFFSRLFRSEKRGENTLTQLLLNEWQLKTAKPISVMSANHVLLDTSLLHGKRLPKALKLIVNRAKIAAE